MRVRGGAPGAPRREHKGRRRTCATALRHAAAPPRDVGTCSVQDMENIK